MRIMAKNHTATKEQRQAGAWRKRGTKSVGGGMLALTSAVVAAAMLATPAALAGEGTARYYSSKQPYVAPASTSYQQFRADTILHTPSLWQGMARVACRATSMTLCWH